MRGKVFVQRYYPDINKKVTAILPIMWEPNQELNVLNALQKINEVMQKSGVDLKEAVEIIYANNNYKININWNKLVEDFKDALLNRENSNRNDLINISEIQN